MPDCLVPPNVSAPEKWNVRDKSLALLQDVCKRRSEAEAESYIRQIRERTAASSIRQLKLELPVLRTDNDCDLRRYKRRICAAREVHLSDHHLPLEPCDDEKDEGLDFPKQAYVAGTTILKSVEDEKIEISRSSVQTLLRYLKAEWTEDDQEALLNSQVAYKGVRSYELMLPTKANQKQLIQRQPITPPLTPKLQAQGDFIPDEQICEVPLPSDPSSRASEDLRKAEDRIFDDDNISGMLMSDVEQPVDSDNADAIDAVHAAELVQKREELKVDEPLLPAVADDQTRLSPDFGGIRQDFPLESSPAEDFQVQRTETALDESMKEVAARAMMEIEQERLEPLDATLRVDVPVMDFSIPELESTKLPSDPASIFKSIPQEHGVSFTGSRWARKLIEESKMVWRIWTLRAPNPAIEEPIDDTALLAAYLEGTDNENPPTSSDFVRKRPGLAILDEDGDDDEEELKPMLGPPRPPQGDWAVLIKKRKLFLDDAQKDASPSGSSRQGGGHRSGEGAVDTGSLLVHEEEGAAARLLDNYLELHAPKKMRVEQSPFFKKTQPPPVKKTRPPESPAENTTRPAAATASKAVRVVTCPEITHSGKPLKLITAVNLPRGMVKQLERLLPGVEMIDRDYNVHNARIWIKGSVCSSEVASPMAHEADLIVSPSTGIILTTMIKVRQKPRPGNGNPALCSRIENVAARYERLVILVSEDNKLDSMYEMTASDAAAFADFQAFAATLPSETMVLYVAGGMETLAKWAAAIAARYAAGSQHLQEHLVQEETHWELFLRRAGMNVYAAQVVLGMLRAPDEEPVINHERAYGLPAFVKMSEEQRYDMFEAVLGGRRVLARMGQILDANWGGAVRR
jgi:hypothetical protein